MFLAYSQGGTVAAELATEPELVSAVRGLGLLSSMPVVEQCSALEKRACPLVVSLSPADHYSGCEAEKTAVIAGLGGQLVKFEGWHTGESTATLTEVVHALLEPTAVPNVSEAEVLREHSGRSGAVDA